MSVECAQWSGQRGGLGRFAHSFGGVECRGHGQDPAFAHDTLFLHLDLQKWQLGFLVFLVFLYFVVQNLPQLHMHSYFQFLIVSLYFIASTAALQQGVPAPSLSQCSSAKERGHSAKSHLLLLLCHFSHV